MAAAEIDMGKLEAFMGQVVTDMGAVISAPLMVIGERLGLYKAMAGAGPCLLWKWLSGRGWRSGRCVSGCAIRLRAAT